MNVHFYISSQIKDHEQDKMKFAMRFWSLGMFVSLSTVGQTHSFDSLFRAHLGGNLDTCAPLLSDSDMTVSSQCFIYSLRYEILESFIFLPRTKCYRLL